MVGTEEKRRARGESEWGEQCRTCVSALGAFAPPLTAGRNTFQAVGGSSRAGAWTCCSERRVVECSGGVRTQGSSK